MKRPRIGEMNSRVFFESLTGTEDSWGDPEHRTWAQYSSRWAKVVALSGRELEQARRMVAEASYSVTVYYFAAVLPTHRIRWRGLTLNIGAVLPSEDLTFLELVCSAAATVTPQFSPGG